MMRQLLASAAAVTLLIGGGASSAFAQAAGNAGSGTSQTGTPPPSTGQPPPAGGTSASPQPAQTLPEVQVIQEQQKAKPKPVRQANKPKNTPATAAAGAPPPTAAPEATAESAATTAGTQFAEPPESNVVKMSPVGGEIPVEKVPGSVYQMNSSDIERSRSVILQDAARESGPGSDRQ